MDRQEENTKLVRFGVSMEQDLLSKFDDFISRCGYSNRSEAIRDLIRKELVSDSWRKRKGSCVAVLTIVYAHHHSPSDLMHRLTHLQHEYEKIIVATVHVHLDRENCMEVIILRGSASKIEGLSNKILSLKGVKYGQLTPGATGDLL